MSRPVAAEEVSFTLDKPHSEPETDFFGCAVGLNVDVAIEPYGQFKLSDLITLGHVRVEKIFAGEPAHRLDLTVGRQTGLDGVLHHLLVHHRQNPRHAEADRAGVGVVRSPELLLAGTENFRLGFQLDMHLQPYNHFIFHRFLLIRKHRFFAKLRMTESKVLSF